MYEVFFKSFTQISQHPARMYDANLNKKPLGTSLFLLFSFHVIYVIKKCNLN